jgi:ABC-2 type transport system permease protein
MLITEAITLMYFAILKYFGKPSIFVAISTLGGFLLLSLAYISFGMFASSITENQIISAIVTIGGLLILLLLPNMGDAYTSFSLIYQFENFTYGLISVSGIITMVSFTVLFILLTIIKLQRRKSVRE